MAIHTTNKLPNFIYPDDSGFMFDLPPWTAVWGFGAWQEGGTYDIPNLPRYSFTGAWTGATQWTEKWSKDWRFAATSDFNAVAQIFPEAADPYMFTEFVFQGTAKADETDGAAAVAHSIVVPPLVNPMAASRSGDTASFTFQNTQPPTFVTREERQLHELEAEWSSDETGAKFWTNELHAMKWREPTPGGTYNTKFTRTGNQRRMVSAMAPAINSGVRIYRQPVWSRSLRWGYSQNVPPRVINMTAPREFLRPTGIFTGKIIPHVTIRAGTPIYDNLASYFSGEQAVIQMANISYGTFSNDAKLTLTQVTPTGTDGPADSTFTYTSSVDINLGQVVPLPKLNSLDAVRYKFIEIPYSNGDLVHRGCAFWEGKAGTIRCKYYWDNQSQLDANSPVPKPVTNKLLCPSYDGNSQADATAHYKLNGGQCPYYTPQGARVVLAYEGYANTQAELNRMRQQLKTPLPRTSGMGGLDGFLADRLIQPLDIDYTPDIDDPNKRFSRPRVEITYEPQVVGVQAKQTYYDTFDGKPSLRDPDGSTKVKAGTGLFPLDEKANEPFAGVDTPFFGLVNQINYRVMQNVQHCYRASTCNSIITTRTQKPGFKRGRYSGVNFASVTYAALRPPNAPASDGTETHCHYGDGYCPYNRLDRRAVEFNENYKILRNEILLPFRAAGIDAFSRGGLREGFLVGSTLTLFAADTEVADKQAWLAANPTAICVGVRSESGSVPVLGHYSPLVSATDPDTHVSSQWRIYFFFDQPSWSSHHKTSHVAAHIIQFDDENNVCYMPMSSDQQSAATTIYGDHTKVPWLVELYDDYREPHGNLVHPTNARPTWGGRSPEYKNHHYRGREIVSSYGYYQRQTIPQEMAGNQFGGAKWTDAPMLDKGTRGYWTDKDGDYFILGSATLGSPVVRVNATTFSGQVSIGDRIRNVPLDNIGGARPINGAPGMSLKDPSNPSLSRSGDYPAVGTTFSNDTKELLDWYRATHHVVYDPVTNLPRNVSNWENLLPEIGEDQYGNPMKPPTAPPAGDFTMLPVERYLYRCNTCHIEYTEEEVNTLADIAAYHPADGAPAGSVIKCHRNDGGHVILQGPYDRIPPSVSRGFIDIWAPPGTTVRHDAFFWKQPQLVSRITETQISHKLGPYNPNGGGYTFTNLSPGVERMGRLPVVTSAGYNPGIYRQIIVPWASLADTLASVRSRVSPWFGLNLYSDQGVWDIAYITRLGVQGDIRVPIADEAATSLQASDLIHYEREMLDGSRRQVGVLICVDPAANAALASESLVVNDTAMPTAPSGSATAYDKAVYEYRLRQWLLNTVDGSYTQWASTASLPINTMSDQLTAQGKDPSLGKPFSPGNPPGTSPVGGGAGTFDLDERVIAPYGNNEAGGLKMVSKPQMQRLRNRILPMLAYDLSTESGLYTSGGDYTQTAQASNSERFQIVKRSIPQAKFGTIPPQVMAATQTGRDHYREWQDKNLFGSARAYYPVGTTWWRINQKIGHICRGGGTNPLHLDADPSVVPANVYADYLGQEMLPYTGNVVSTVTYFIHGRLPMDKDVAKAYLVYTVDDGPSAAALGCRGKYDGYEGTRNQDGTIRPETAVYRGNSECFYEHFHPWTTSHESDIGGYASGAVHSIWTNPGYAGFDSRRHWMDGGNNDPSVPWTLSDFVATPQAESTFDGPETWRWRTDEEVDGTYWPAVSMLGMSFYDESRGFEFTQPFLDQWVWGEDLRQLKPENRIWKEMSFSDYQRAISTYTARVVARVNDIGAVQSFTYIAQPFRSKIHARQHQGIPGWLDYTNYDNSGRFPKKIEIADRVVDTQWANGPQVIVQSESTSASSNWGGGGSGQAGNVARVLDVTNVLKTIYNKRVDRYYAVTLGQAYADLFDFMRAKTDTNVTDPDPYSKTDAGLAKRFHAASQGGGEYAPMYWWNYRYFYTNGRPLGMWLTDPWHHPPLVNDSPTDPGEGDLIEQSEADQDQRVFEVSTWDTQGLAEDDPDYKQYHPIALCASDTNDFDDVSTSTSTRPAPQQMTNSYWRAYTTTPVASWFSMDLRQVPYEQWRRPWRYQPPQVDATNATCPNTTSCWVAQRNMTVGELYQQQVHRIWGGMPPSLTSSRCSICNTPLSGLVTVDGDGITTVEYDPVDQPDAIVNAIEVSMASLDGIDTEAKHGYVIEYWNSLVSQWRMLYAVNYITATNKFQYKQWNGSEFAWVEADNPPEVIRGWAGDHLGHPLNLPNNTQCHFIVVAAQKIRFKVVRPVQIDRLEPSPSTYYTGVPDPAGRSITVASLTGSLTQYPGRKITLYDINGANPVVGTITACTQVESGVKVSVNVNTPDTLVKCRIGWTEYLARATKFRVYGYPYAKGEAVFTPPGYIQDLLFGPGTSEFPLSTTPTQITRVACSAGDDPAIEMTEATTTATDFHWSVTTETYGTVSFKRITGGKWYYDYSRNCIVVPTTYLDGGTAKNIWELNSDLYDAGTLLIDTLPSKMSMEYIRDLGVPVDVEIKAAGKGPSYQLDVECITGIAEPGDPLPPGITTTALPAMGQSVRLRSLNGNRETLKWSCYNHSPVVWKTDLAMLNGHELGAGAWGMNAVCNLYTGGHGSKVSDLGPNSFIRGYATGTVTLYGSPGVFLSGSLAVYAKAYTSRSYNTSDGPVKTYERTGGLYSGALFFQILVDDLVTSGRKSVSCSVPKLLVYLKERPLTQPIDMNTGD